LATTFTDVMSTWGKNGDRRVDGWSVTKNQNGNARESHWNGKKFSNLETAEFGFFAGHGSEGTLYFCQKDARAPDYNFSVTSQPAWGSEGKLKWVVLHSCLTLNHTQENQDNWKNLIKQTGTTGIHSIMGFDSSAKENNSETWHFARLIKGVEDGYVGTPWEILKAWEYTLRQNVHDSHLSGAYVYDASTLTDHLPGLGGAQTATRRNIIYKNLIYKNFVCVPEPLSARNEVIGAPRTVGKYLLNTTIPEVPKTITVYKPVYNTMTKEKVEQLARALHLPGEVTENNVNYQIDSDDFYFFASKKSGQRTSSIRNVVQQRELLIHPKTCHLMLMPSKLSRTSSTPSTKHPQIHQEFIPCTKGELISPRPGTTRSPGMRLWCISSGRSGVFRSKGPGSRQMSGDTGISSRCS
jgi:hypothetical protein